jgi:putative flippase GtrA
MRLSVFLARRTMNVFLSRQFARFFLVGTVAAALHWLYRFVINMFVSYEVALIGAYLISLFSGFLLTKYFVFPLSTKSISHQATFFALFNVSMLPVVLGISFVLSEFVFAHLMSPAPARGLAHALGVVAPAVINFVLQKFVAFEA